MHSFIIKVWLEQVPEAEDDSVTWHGHITHVPGGERAYLKDLDAATAFITAYLEAYGVRVRTSRRLARRLRRLLVSARRTLVGL